MDFIVKISIGLAVTWLFYWLLLRRLTFYRWNRLFLLVYPAMAFLVPFIDITDLLHQGDDKAWLRAIPVLEQYSFRMEPQERIVWLTPASIGLLVLAAGSIIMAARFCWQYWSLRKTVSGAVLLADDEARLYHVNKHIVPFSFGRSIYLNKDLHTEAELQEILRHEFIHVKQRHSLDMIWGELLCIINWYNPFAWLLRNAIRQNLEFIADHQVLANGVDRKQYQYMLLKVTGMSAFSVANNFNLSSLKKRIIMMNKKTSATVHLLRFVLIVPVLAVLLLAFRSVTHSDLPSPSNLITEKMFADTTVDWEEMIVLTDGDTIRLSAQKIIADTVPKKKTSLPDNIEHIYIHQKNNAATVRLKNGTVEKYDLTDAKQKEAYEKKYGKFTPPPPPPAPGVDPVKPAPPAPPAPVKGNAMPVPPIPPAPPKPVGDEYVVVGKVANVEARPEVVVAAKPVTVKGKAAVIAEGKSTADVKTSTSTQVDAASSVTVVGYKTKKEEPVEQKLLLRYQQNPAIDLNLSEEKRPLIVIDGKIATDQDMNQIDPKSIESVNILKGESATSLYGEKGKNGVILVNLKKEEVVVTGYKRNVLDEDLCKMNALILIDGKIVSCQDANAFMKNNKETIAAVEIFKGAERVKEATGQNAQNAIVIKTKKQTD
jgi:TonB-dependent SusC/RagA subfamily outer membrane receptor